MKYGNFIEVYNNISISPADIQHDFIQVLDLDISDTDALRRYYSGEASGILKKHNARQIVSTSAARNVKGQMHPKYLIINTWESEECFQQAYCGGKSNVALMFFHVEKKWPLPFF